MTCGREVLSKRGKLADGLPFTECPIRGALSVVIARLEETAAGLNTVLESQPAKRHAA